MRIPDPSERPLLRPDELLALHPTLTRSTIYRAIRRGDLPAIRIGSRIYVITAELRALVGLSEGA